MEVYERLNIHTARDKAEVDMVLTKDCYNLHEQVLDKEGLCIDLRAGCGAFATLYHILYPGSPIACVEADQANIPALEVNVKSFATVIHATCTYLPWRPEKPHRKVTLADVLEEAGKHQDPVLAITRPKSKIKFVSIIKMDEVFAYNILANVNDSLMERTQMIVGAVAVEDAQRFYDTVHKRFPYWSWKRDGRYFSMRNPYYDFRKKCE